MTSLKIGSRGSQLALWQAHYIAERLTRIGVETEIEIIRTTGDRMQAVSLVKAGGKGLFTKEIEEALLAGDVDIAVHSLKDLPTEHPRGLGIAAVPEREDPRDALVGRKLSELPSGARVGTSSNRRAAQLRLLRKDLDIGPVRGNVDTRLRKLREGQYDSVVLAAAGLRRLGLEHEIVELFSPEQICPAPGQGALAVQTRTNDDAFDICRSLNHEPSAYAVECERSVLSSLGGGCQLPIGAFAHVHGDRMHVIAGVFAPDASSCVRASGEGSMLEAAALGKRVGDELLAKGASSICALS
jgi:hydroxymethylbilane synthase